MTVDEITSYSSLEEGDKHNDIGSFENKQIPSEIEGFKVREMEKWNLQIGIFSGIHFDRLISFRVQAMSGGTVGFGVYSNRVAFPLS